MASNAFSLQWIFNLSNTTVLNSDAKVLKIHLPDLSLILGLTLKYMSKYYCRPYSSVNGHILKPQIGNPKYYT